ncbi:Multicopper oxidase type 2 [Penicillium odoratum]|uniref:Multicopper oxidase type 2 n=1 Tax=Penicillium odoratum TaxID=1167516 RepID=UPI002548E92D|nr:Multicopper oxidase type 2 [Penicillium odoratum]KAJ5758378.1 Multicopper oxidase type 2 [Penicillium odoratum]
MFIQRLLPLGILLWPTSVGGNPTKCVHYPHSRKCWLPGFDITDYEKEIPPGGLVEYELTVSNQVISPDGYLTNGMVINGQYPGPTIEANWGDTLRAIKIHGPSSMDYDVDLGPVLMSDWYHEDAFALYPTEILTPQAPLPESNVMNGKGVFDCDPLTDLREHGNSSYKFWIDGHNFTVVQNDFVPIQPYETDVLIVGIGQRFEIVIKANANFTHGTNFWMHANYCDNDTWESRLGIIRYDALNTSNPHTSPVSEQHYGFGCQDPPPESLFPIVKRQVGQNVNSFDTPDYLRTGL